MIINVPLGIAFIAAGGIVYLLRLFGFMQHRYWYHWLPEFLIGNGIGFFIPAHLYWDGFALGALFILVDEYRHWRQKQRPALKKPAE